MLAIQSLLAVETERDPHAYYAYLRQHDPVHYDDGAGAYLLTRHEDVGAAYRHPVSSTANYKWQLEPVMGRTILQMAGREHANVRGMMSPYFRGRGLRSWLPLIEGTVRGLLDESVRTTVDGLVSAMARGTEVDLVPRFSNLLPVYVIAEVLGLPRSDHALFYGWYQAQSEFLSNLSRDPQVERRGERALRELREYLAPFVVRRRIEPGDDFISMLAQAEVDGRRLTDEEVMTHATHLLNAGSETTDRTVTSLLLVIASANRDERRFANATEFDMYRDDIRHEQAFSGVGEHFAFGFGRHFCLGAMVARSELEISLNALLDSFPDMRLAPGSTVEERGLKMRSPQALRVVL